MQIKAAGINYIDIYFREGRYPATPPFVNGQEGAGVVSEIGSEVKNLKVGRAGGLHGRARAATRNTRRFPRTDW